MKDLLLPRTDAGVAFQLVIATALFAVVLWRHRANKDVRVLVIGLYVAALAFMDVRALH